MKSVVHRLLLTAVAAVAFSGPVLRAEFVERFDRFGVGRSLVVREGTWKKFGHGANAQPAGNKAIIGEEQGRRYVTLTAFGHRTVSARVYRDLDASVSAQSHRVVSADIRAVSPGSPDDTLTNTNVALNANRDGVFDPTGTLSFGVLGSGAGASFFFDLGKGNRVVSRPSIVVVNPRAWYRFSVELDPASGVAKFTVAELTDSQPRTVWSGDNAGLSPYNPQTFYQLNLSVSRPGSDPGMSRSADFSAISITP